MTCCDKCGSTDWSRTRGIRLGVFDDDSLEVFRPTATRELDLCPACYNELKFGRLGEIIDEWLAKGKE